MNYKLIAYQPSSHITIGLIDRLEEGTFSLWQSMFTNFSTPRSSENNKKNDVIIDISKQF